MLLRYVKDQLLDPAAFVQEVERINLTSETSQDEISLKDGRLLSRRSVPLKDPSAFAARLWIFTDVTETEYARTDALCGISNRRAYASEYPQFVEGADDGLMRSVGILDIDNFKAYNDQYGHAAGDIVLRQIGALLRHCALAQDGRAYRIGGEEFLLVCKTQGASDALAFFEALRIGILNMQLPHTGNPPHNMVTTSIGLSIFRGPKQSLAIFDRVDAALYRAKHAGRNIIELA
ncbi:GGDEF domain-containing protein [Sphingomonas aerolata]|uniref:GGDEF domain-containing protein n=1 Tax=Sphingomonas aerolata TaxID=185951 RepID=UPI002FE3E5F0